MLCDSAQVAEGKLYILGGGWSVTGPGMAPMAVALRIDVDWAQAPEAHHWELFLVDQDGGEVAFEGPDGEMQPIEVRGDFQVGIPQGVPEGSDVPVNLAINMGPLPLTPGGRYTWRLVINGESREDWVTTFTTRPVPLQAV